MKRINKLYIVLIFIIILALGVYYFVVIKSDESDIRGKWIQNIKYEINNETVKETYAEYIFKNDNKFEYIKYDKNNENIKIEYDGNYEFIDDYINLRYLYKGELIDKKIYIDKDILCEKENTCTNKFINSKSKKDNTIVIEEKNKKIIDYSIEEIKYITYKEYEEIINNKKDAVIFIVHNGCIHCDKYKNETINNIGTSNIEMYFYEYDFDNDNIKGVQGTPTTFIIRNGEIRAKLVGKKSLNDLENAIEKSNFS